MHYYTGFSYLMMRRYQDAVRTFQNALVRPRGTADWAVVAGCNGLQGVFNGGKESSICVLNCFQWCFWCSGRL